MVFFFFFQAEDGIRDADVTGVQTCALPICRSTVHALDVIAYTGEVVTLDIRVSSGTYVRAIAEALGGHCRALRRTEVGPFSVADAVSPEAFEPRLLLAEAEVLERVGAPA